MAQRRTKNLRKRSGNNNSVLDENTNIFDRDPLWVNRTIVRPSMSFNISQNDSTMLNPSSDVNSSQLTEDWYKNLSHSDTSKIIRLISKNKAKMEKQNVKEYSVVDAQSDEELTTKKPKLKTYSKKKSQSKKSNLFEEAFDQSKSTSKNLNEIQASVRNENSSSSEEPKVQKKFKRILFRTAKKPDNNSTNKFDTIFNSSRSLEQNKDSKSSRSNMSFQAEEQLRCTVRLQKQNFKSHQFSSINNIVESMNKAENANVSSRCLRSKSKSNISFQIASPNRSSVKRSDDELKKTLENNNSSLQCKIEIVENCFDPLCSPKSIVRDNSLIKKSKNKEQKQKSLSTSALRDVQNTISITKPSILSDDILLPGSKNYIPPQKKNKIQKPSKSTGITDKTDQSVPKTSPKKIPQTRAPSHSSNSENTHSDLIQSPTPAQSTLKFHGKPMTDFPQTFGLKQIKNNRQKMDNSENMETDVNNSSEELLPNKLNYLIHAERSENKVTTTDDEGVTAFFNKTSTKTKKQLALQAYTSNFGPEIWEKVRKKTKDLKEKLEAQNKKEKEAQREQEKKNATITVQLRRIQALKDAQKKKKLKKPIDKAYYVDDKLYKQPKLPKPKKWVTPKLYKYLWKAMEPKFGRKTRIISEKFVLKLSNIYTVIIRRSKYENYESELNGLLVEMAKLNIVKTRYDFYRFCSEFMPANFHNKVVPMMLPGNERNIPYDPELVDKPILNESSSDGDSKENPEDCSESDLESE